MHEPTSPQDHAPQDHATKPAVPPAHWPHHLELTALRPAQSTPSVARRSAVESSPTPSAVESSQTNVLPRNSSPSVPQAEALELTSVWQLTSPNAADASFAGGTGAFAYRRVDPPNARSLATKLAALHAGARAVVTAQGMSSLAAIAMTALRPSAQVWLGNELYGETSQLFSTCLKPWGVRTRTFDPTDPSDLHKLASEAVDMVVVETITNPRGSVPDLALVARATHDAGGLLVVDNTFATHLLCQPLQLGADLVIESLGKIVNGHSDGMAGMVCGRDEQLLAGIAATVKTFGLTSSPLDCYLTHRGLLSLSVRMERACANALALAHALSQVPGITRVDYPGLVTSPQHFVASRQLIGGYGWMLSFQIAPQRAAVERLCAALRPEICFVPSLGDATTTLSHPLSTSHRATPAEQREQLGIDEGTIRISCGIEPTEWLVDRFLQAF